MGRPRIKTFETAIDPDLIGVKTEKVEKIQEEPVESESSNIEATDSVTIEAEPKKKAPSKKAKAKKAKVRGKKYQQSVTLVEKDRNYPLTEALEVLKKASYSKFDSTIEAHFNLGVDPAKSDQKVRGIASLPHGGAKKLRLLVFGLTKKAEGVEIGDEETLSELESGKINADKIIVTPDWMPKLAKLAKVLGPKGLMPNPKSGTVTENPEKAISELQAGAVEFKSENQPVVHVSFGKISWEEKKLEENFRTLYNAIMAAKPDSVKKNYLKSVYLTATMSPSVKLDLSTINP